VEEVKDYRAPATSTATAAGEGEGEGVKKSGALPLCNYMVAAGLDIPQIYQRDKLLHHPQAVMTKAEYAKIHKDYKGTEIIGNSHRVRVAMIRSTEARKDDPNGLGAHGLRRVCVFLSDSKTHEPPAAVDKTTPAPLPRPVYQAPEKSEQAQQFDALRDTLRAGVQVVVAPQLFTTRPDIAARAADLLGVELGQWVLDPSAGTAALLQALPGVMPFLGPVRQTWAKVVAVEINADLAQGLRRSGLAHAVFCADFMTWEPEGGQLFDRVIMNPPFADACDIKHILRALGMVKPGGRLVAICADGPRQRDALKPIADHWEELPADAFAHAGTNVRAALLVINK
jgi:protein-L-isoaspartate O-methyltransferase